LTLKHGDSVSEVIRPQDPKKPFPYLEEQVTYQDKSAAVTLAGTLTMPDSKGPFPAVLLISGSGPQDRDETLLGHHPFLVLADYLTRQGIAVLRADDRGIGKSTGDFVKATSADFADDARAGIEFLRSRKEINQAKIGLIGHSEGALIAFMIAAEDRRVAFIVSISGPALPGDSIIYLQAELIGRANGAPDSAIAAEQSFRLKMFDVIKHETDSLKADAELRMYIRQTIVQSAQQDNKDVDTSSAVVDQQMNLLTSPWLKFFLKYDPRTDLQKVRCPLLAVMGDKDLQVPPEQNRPALESALKSGGNNKFTVKEFPNLNHLLQTAETGSPMEYSKIEETMSPDALILIGQWILKQN
jgi:hypothetical protein